MGKAMKPYRQGKAFWEPFQSWNKEAHRQATHLSVKMARRGSTRTTASRSAREDLHRVKNDAYPVTRLIK
ncbi:hypothetical protein N7504_008665 [Penicillium tannophilum]|nr:hypothetical protein N7504_008665 [Penicillium tannophilum]